MRIAVPDGGIIEHQGAGPLKEVLAQHDRKLLRRYVGARDNGQLVDFHTPLPAQARVELVPWESQAAQAFFRHSLSHVLAQAVLHLFPQAQLGIGPAIDEGFYYDFDVERPFTPEDLQAVERQMQRIVKRNERFERLEVPRQEALRLLAEAPYKQEILNDLAAEETISFYRDGDFVDLCRGPHVLSTGQVGHFKLLSTAGAYWRGDEHRRMMQRIYGTAFATREALEEHLQRMEEARRRDHRVLGRQLHLFVIDEQVGQGLVLWTPRGAAVRQELQSFISAELRKQGYEQVFTPHIGRLDLYRTSGHFPYYQDSQYPPLIEREQLDGLAAEGCSCADLANRMRAGQVDGYLLKPMNCPHHVKIYASQPRSYRDLPVRLAEFGTVYRWEQSGEIGGLTRVRGFTQDDAHLFCTEEQVGPELLGCLDLVMTIFTTLGMTDYRVRVGLRDPDSSKYVGEPAHWDRAETACRAAAQSLGVPFSEEPGEAAFYGPKIDFIVRDVVGRQWQLGTVQVDYNLPQRFGLEYAGQDGQPHRPVMIHRAPFGALERFVGVLIEHFAGAFPVWLAPVQAVVLPIAERHEEYAAAVHRQLLAAGVRAELDGGNQTLNYRIRQAQVQKVPYMLIAGDREAQSGQVAIRRRSGETEQGVPVAQAVSTIHGDIVTRALG
ncbi:MAG: threonine--tRNA ligase [Candidatus Latescibacterota bacterium]